MTTIRSLKRSVAMSLAVDNPILNNPFEEPKEYLIYLKRERKYGFKTG